MFSIMQFKLWQLRLGEGDKEKRERECISKDLSFFIKIVQSINEIKNCEISTIVIYDDFFLL